MAHQPATDEPRAPEYAIRGSAGDHAVLLSEQPPATDVLDTAAAGGLVIRGAAIRIVAYTLGTLFAVGSAVLLTRHLGVSRFGQYTTIISLVTVTGTITDLGMTNLATREYAVRIGSERERLLSEVLGLRIFVSVVGITLAGGFALLAGYDATRVLATVLAGVGIMLVSLQVTAAVPLSTMLRLGTTSGLELLRQTVWVVLLVILVLLGGGLLPLLAANIPAGILVLATTWAITRREGTTVRPALRPTVWMPLLRDTLTFSLATGVGALYVFTSQIVTSLAATPRQNGLFAASFRVFIVAASVAGLLVTTAFPVLARAARDDHERLRYAVQRLVEAMLVFGCGAALAVVTGAAPIIEVVAGPRYAASAAPLRIEGAALVASFLVPAWGIALVSLHKHRALAVSNLFAFSATAALTALLASSHGATGAAIATVGGEWMISTACLIALASGERRLRLSPRAVLKVAGAALPAFAVMALGLPGVAQLLLALTVYAGAVLLLKAVPAEFGQLLPRFPGGMRR